MAGSTAIYDVGKSLVDLLKDRMTDLNLGELDNAIILASPGDLPEEHSVALTLFLYRVAENPAMKNAPRQEVRPPDPTGNGDQFRPAPLALDLYYLLTAYPADTGELSTRAKSQQENLGRAMQVFAENSVLRGSDLSGSLAADEHLRLSIYPEREEDLLSIWGTFPDRTFVPSVAYVVTPVEIESRVSEPVPRTTGRTVRSGLIRPERPETDEEETDDGGGG